MAANRGAQLAGKLDAQEAGKVQRGRKLSDSGAKARFFHEVSDAHLARIIKVDLKCDLFTYSVSDQPSHLEQSRDISQDRVHVNHRGHHAQRFTDTEICNAANPPDLYPPVQGPIDCGLPAAWRIHCSAGPAPWDERQCVASLAQGACAQQLSQNNAARPRRRWPHKRANTRIPARAAATPATCAGHAADAPCDQDRTAPRRHDHGDDLADHGGARLRGLDARVAAMIRIDSLWLCRSAHGHARGRRSAAGPRRAGVARRRPTTATCSPMPGPPASSCWCTTASACGALRGG